MHTALRLHPASPPSPIARIRAEAARLSGGRLALTFIAEGDLARVRIPAGRAPERTGDLWQGTCFEAFLRSPGAEAYVELNFSPSSEWAAWRFDRYRSGMREAEIAAPAIEARAAGRRLTVTARAALGPLPELAPRQSWEIGLAAIVEAEDGALSHWALAHPPGAPDFHHRDCFAAILAPAAAS
jgi:hypothetical protein